MPTTTEIESDMHAVQGQIARIFQESPPHVRPEQEHAGTCVAVRAVNFCRRIFRFASANPQTPVQLREGAMCVDDRGACEDVYNPAMCVDEGTCSDPSLEIRCLADKTRAPSKLSIRSPSSTHSRGDRCVQSHSIMGHLLPIHLSSRRSGRYLLTQILNGLAWHRRLCRHGHACDP